MNSIFFIIITFFSVTSLCAAQEGGQSSPTDFSLVRVLEDFKGNLFVAVSNELDKTKEQFDVPQDFFKGVKVDELKPEEIAEHIELLRKQLAHYESLQQTETKVSLHPKQKDVHSVEHHILPVLDEHVEPRQDVFKELMSMRLQLKPTQKPHPAQSLEPRELTDQEKLVAAVKDKLNGIFSDTHSDQESPESDKEFE